MAKRKTLPIEDQHVPYDARRFIAGYERFVGRYYGKRCEAVAPGCAVCKAWALFDLVRTEVC